MIMIKAKTDIDRVSNISIMVDGPIDVCIGEMADILDKLAYEKPYFTTAVLKELVEREKKRLRN